MLFKNSWSNFKLIMSTKLGLKIKIIEFADNSQPGFVNCTFTDSFGQEYKIFDKVPVVTDEYLDENSDYPKDGIVSCVILDENPDKTNADIVQINIAEPLHISTVNDETIFFVYKNQLTDYDKWTSKK